MNKSPVSFIFNNFFVSFVGVPLLYKKMFRALGL